jgi:(p)ppGpp synthase/HD superfamily hydrolase
MQLTKQEELDAAARIAHAAHNGAKRWGGEAYITHPAAVAFRLEDLDDKIVAWLHDVIEDTWITPEFLYNEGISMDNVRTILILTHQQGESYHAYIMRVRKDPRATRVKLEDLAHNLSDLPPGTRRDKYLLAEQLLKETQFGE